MLTGKNEKRLSEKEIFDIVHTGNPSTQAPLKYIRIKLFGYHKKIQDFAFCMYPRRGLYEGITDQMMKKRKR